jgi:Holliday junction resolvase RusA-like endonuclease
MAIVFTITGIPKPKGRPKFFRRGSYVGTYTPKDTEVYEGNVLAQAVKYKPERPLDTPFFISLRFLFQAPKSLTKKQKALVEQEALVVGKKPDIDNLVKSVLDPLNGVFWTDDKLCARLFASKYYSYNPRTEVEIHDIETPDI